MAETSRAQFATRIGFILAAIGSAVGFGSIARFPMNAANQGGAAFVLMYIGIMVLIGVPMMVAEFSLGRTAQRNVVGAWNVLTGDPTTRWRLTGVFYVAVAVFLLSWYAVATGWVLRYLVASLGGDYFDDPSAYFADTEAGPDTLGWHFAVLAITFIALAGNVSKGIERVNFVMMPALFSIVIGLAVYAATLDNVGEGYRFYLNPDFTAVTLGAFTAAVGQAFFSLSLGQGAMMTYASYIPATSSLASNALLISLSTLGFAVTCGFMIFPLLASFGLLGTEAAGIGLIFGPLSQVFAGLGSPTGNIVGAFFFLATFFAAFTSAISLAEPGIAYVAEEFRVDRARAALLICTLVYSIGIGAAFSPDLLGFESGALNDALVITGALLIALYVGWGGPADAARARMDESESGLRIGAIAYPVVKWAFPLLLSVLLFFALAGTPCALGGDPDKPGVLEILLGLDLLGCND